jgi:sugar lactone lactonase YvrE
MLQDEEVFEMVREYELIAGWARLPEGWTFNDVCGISVDPQDNVYVLSRSDHPIMVFDCAGNLQRSWGEGFFNRAHGSCVAPDGAVWCTDDRHHIVAKFSPTGELLMTLGTKGEHSDTGYVRTFDSWESLARIVRSGPPFNRPTGVCVADSGDVFITDGYGNACVHCFSSEGRLRLSWGGPGGKPSQFRLPHDLVLDGAERLWVVDRENSRLQVFDKAGHFLFQWTDVFRPTGVCIDSEGFVYVSELALRVTVFAPDGAVVAQFGNPGIEKETALFHAPHSIAVDSNGDIYVGEASATYAKVDKGPNAIQKFRRVR